MKNGYKNWCCPMVIMAVILILACSCMKDKDENPSTSDSIVTDVDGNVYHVVTIGTQVWMVENLKTTRYSNGDTIPNVRDDQQWLRLSTGGYCDYNNIPDNSGTYGRLYNRHAMYDNRRICPAGWHVPFCIDWDKLTDCLGGGNIAGGRLKEAGMIHWAAPNEGADNSSGFTGLPGGGRFDGMFSQLGYRGFWWTPNAMYISGNPIFYKLSHDSMSIIARSTNLSGSGLSVRCIKD